MMPDPSMRNFKGGSWDLRRTERRQAQVEIPFPDRRLFDRRTGMAEQRGFESEVTWVSRPRSDE